MAKKNNINKIKCIYCGKRKATTRDHVPPRSFFTPPLTSDLITVPSCENCNNRFGKHDEYIKDVFLSLDTTEHLPDLVQQRQSMWRSFSRPEAIRLAHKIYGSIQMVDVYSPAGIFLGQRPAFNFDREEFNIFFERIARGLLHRETGLGYVNGKIEWKMSFDEETYHSSPGNIKFFLSQGFYKSIANGQFKYLAFYKENHIGSLWFVRFFDVIEFMILLRDVNFQRN